MRALSALFAALIVTFYAGVAAADCASYTRPAADQAAQTPILPPQGSVGS